MTLTQEQLEAHESIKTERALGLRLSMLRECAELAVRQCLEFAPRTDQLARKRVEGVLEEILATTKQTFFAIKDLENDKERYSYIKDADPKPVSRKLCMRDEEDRSVDTLARTVLANLNSATRVVAGNVEQYEVPIRTMVEDESLALAISRVELAEGSASPITPDAYGGVQYSIHFALRHLQPDQE